jgi:hypothetical protein
MALIFRLVLIAFVAMAGMYLLRAAVRRLWPTRKLQPSPRRDRVLASLDRGITLIRRVALAGLAVIVFAVAVHFATRHSWNSGPSERAQSR